MSENICYRTLREMARAQGLRIKDERLRTAADRFDNLQQSGLSRAQVMQQVTEFFDTHNKIERARMQNLRLQELDLMARNLTAITANTDRMGSAGAFISHIDGSSYIRGQGTNVDIGNVREAVMRDLWGETRARVRELGEREILSGVLDKDAFAALHAIRNNEEMPKGLDPKAIEWARVIHGVNEATLERTRAVSPYVEASDEFLTNRNHVRGQLPENRQEWLQKMNERFGQKSFPGLSPAEKTARFNGIYDAIDSGRWGDIFRDDEASVALRLGRGRTLVANDWKAEYDHMVEFGHGNLYTTLFNSVDSASRNIAVMEKFGTTPRENTKKLYQRYKEFLSRTGNEKELTKLIAKKDEIDGRVSSALNRFNNTPVTFLGQLVQTAQTWEYLTSLQNAMLSSMSDLPNAITMSMNTRGGNMFTNAKDLVGHYFTAFTSNQKDRADLMQKAGLFASMMEHELLIDSSINGSTPGTLAKMARRYGDVILLNRHVQAARYASAMMFKNIMAEKLPTSFDQLDPGFKDFLKSYNIAGPEWALYKNLIVDSPASGPREAFKAVDAEMLRRLPNEDIHAYLVQTGRVAADVKPEDISQRLYDRERNLLGDKLGIIFSDAADYGSSTPKTRQRFWATMGHSPDHPIGIIARLMTQFKTASMMQFDMTRRVYNSKLNGDYMGVARHVSMLMFVGAVKEYAVQAASGKTPEDPNPVTNPKFLMKILLRGAGGLYGDMLASFMQPESEANKTKAVLSSLAGPVVSGAVEAGSAVVTMAESAVDQDKDFTLKPAAKLLESNMPFKAFWIKAAFDYLIFNAAKEQAGVDLYNIESKVDKVPGLFDDNQRYFMNRPTEHFWR